MKICPRCQKTYVDDNLNFCLEDGSVLTQASSSPPPDTVFINQPMQTQPQPSMPSQPSAQPSWNTPQAYSMQPPQKSSKTWIWVVGILGLLVLICGGGFGALMFIGMMNDNSNRQQNTANLRPNNGSTTNRPTSNTSTSNNSTTSNTSTTPTRSDLETVDLEPWVKEFSAYGNTEFTGGEFIMSSKRKGFYYVLVAPEEFKSTKADTRVTLRNMDDAAGSLGYGLIFHSNPTPLQQGYAFLIDTKKKKYRVVHHEPQNEKSVVSWTASPAIKEGSAENVLEARDIDDHIDLYINGTMVTSVKNVYGYANGVPGLYSGDGVKVAFKNLEIRK